MKILMVVINLKRKAMKDIFKEMEELRAKLDELSAYAEKECKKPKMFPQEGDEYWYWDVSGYVHSAKAYNSNGRLSTYKTEEEASKARDIQWAKQRVAHAIAVENDGWVPDWKNDNHLKNSIYLTSNMLEAEYHYMAKTQPSWMYMKSKEIAEKILAEHKEDLLLILSE